MGWLAVFLAYLIGKGLARAVEPAPGPFAPSPPRPPVPPAPHPHARVHRHPTSPAAQRVPVPPRPSRRGTSPAAQTVPAVLVAPWPQVTPQGLPPFPGGDWELDTPPPPAVVSRAQQLLNPLWQGGAGTFKVENTAGRWIVYRASQMGDKKGVVAYRETPRALQLTRDFETQQAIRPSTPTVRASTQAPPGSDTASLGLPLLKLGSGYSGGPDAESVRIVQRKLLLSPVDGKFGPNTDKAVRAFQSKNGLLVDGKVGNQTWGALLGRSA